jgi:phospholipid/cholesterol/gamma-HCH transport system substrate-binding protein
MNKISARVRRINPLAYGTFLVLSVLLVAALVFERPMVNAVLSPGDTITAVFDRDYRLAEYVDPVKIAGVEVGRVTTVEALGDGRSRVGLKLDSGTVEKLGNAPSAAIRPATLLGGKYYVELVPGGTPGAFSGEIPRNRTRIAVELDAIVQTLQPQARQGLRQFVDKLDATLAQGGTPALQKLARDAPATLEPAGPVFYAAGGDRPETLTKLVRGLDRTASVLTRQQGQLQDILSSLNATSAVLDETRAPLSETIRQGPETLRTTKTGMVSLRTSLDKLTETAGDLRPTAHALDPLLKHLDPVLGRAIPVIADLRDVVDDLRPTLRDLEPAASRGAEVLDDLSGPVLDRVNGPILGALNSPWKGEGRYAGNGSPYLLYQDIAYLFTNVNGATKYLDKNGSGLSIQVGVGGADALSDVQGLPNSEQLLRDTIGPKESPDAHSHR